MLKLKKPPTFFDTLAFFQEQETVPLVNHAFARVTPANFVISVLSRGLSSKALVLRVRTQIRHFRCFLQKNPTC